MASPTARQRGTTMLAMMRKWRRENLKLGIAYFNSSTRELFATELWEDPSTALDYPCTQLIKFQVQPSVIFASSKADEKFLDALKTPIGARVSPFEVKIAKSASFGFDQAMQRLMCLRTSEVAPDLDADRWRHQLGTMISLSREVQVRAVGGLLAALNNEMVLDSDAPRLGNSRSRGHGSEESDEDQEENRSSASQLGIRRISELKMERYLTVDATSYEALQIFQTDRHPSAMGLGKPKEGFSVFGMLNNCVTARGRQLLRLWFLRPILDVAELEDRQNTISFFCSSCPDLNGAILDTLRRIKDVPKIMQKLASPCTLTSRKEWQPLQESMNALAELRQLMEAALSQMPSNSVVATARLQLFPQVANALNEDLIHARDLICGVIDLDQACGMRTDTIVAEGICEELDDLKQLFQELPDFLFKVMDMEKARFPPAFLLHISQEWNQLVQQQHHSQAQKQQQQQQQQQQQREHVKSQVAPEPPAPGGHCPHFGLAIKYFPQIGYLLRVPGPHPIPNHLLQQLSDFELAFEGEDDELGRSQFYHTARTRDLDKELGDIFHKILDMESVILRDLTSRLMEHHFNSMLAAAAVAARIDCLLSLARSAVEYKLTRPKLSTGNVLNIAGGRHLLQELTVDTFVPNDTFIRESSGRILIITGPNFSGKSVYVKQVALIVFLAHIGSFVPAASAIVGLTDRIFTRMASKDLSNSAAGTLGSGGSNFAGQGQSTFSLDVRQMVAMMRQATPASLCIVDEFGKGTLTSDGVGLLCAVTNHFARQSTPPKVLLCTHFNQIANTDFVPQSPQVSFYTMSILDPQQQQRLRTGRQGAQPNNRAAQDAGNGDADAEEHLQDEDITFLYRLTLGRTLESFGFHCATMAGVPGTVTARAREIERCMRLGKAVERSQSATLLARDAQYKELAQKLMAFDPGRETAWQFIRRVVAPDDAASNPNTGGPSQQTQSQQMAAGQASGPDAGLIGTQQRNEE